MGEWSTYRPEDFLLFSEQVYWRLFELHNQALWPAPLVALAAGATILILLVRPRPWSGRIVALILAAAWSFVAWFYLWDSYATINWAAPYAVPFFIAETLMLVWLGGIRGRHAPALRRNLRSAVRLALVVYALFIHPVTAIIAGRPIASAELFGLTPDPTAIATLGLLGLSGGGRSILLLYIVPVGWCLISWMTLYTMGTWEAWIPLAAVVFALATRPWRIAATPA